MKISIRNTAALIAFAVLPLSGCQDLLDVTIDGQVIDNQLNSAATARALRLGALGTFAGVNGGFGEFTGGISSMQTMPGMSGLLTDEIVNRTTTQPSPVIDQRIDVGNGEYADMQDARTRAFEAITAIEQFLPATAFPESRRLRGELFFTIGYVALQFGENFCAGVPLSRRIGNDIIYGDRLTSTQMYDSAIAYFDTALELLTDTATGVIANDTAAMTLRRAVRVAKARALNNRGIGGSGGDADAMLPLLAAVPTNFAYRITFGGATTSSVNVHYEYMRAGVSRASMGDSINPDGSTLTNALPFASAPDPRTPRLGNSAEPSSEGRGNLSLPIVRQNIFRTPSTPLNLVSGLDARLMEAEVQLKKGNIGSMTTILNNLRATTIALSTDVTYNANSLLPLVPPLDQTAAVRLFLREKAFWTWGRAQRLGDLRRVIRQWGPALPNRPAPIQDLDFEQEDLFPVGNVFDVPNGPFTTVNQYGAEINFTFTGENANTNFSPDWNSQTPDSYGRIPGLCLDREA